MTQSVKCLSHKLKHMGLTHGTHIKVGMMACTCKSSAGDGESGVCYGGAGQPI